METNNDYSAKIIGKDREHFLTYSLTFVGRNHDNSSILSEDVQGKNIYFLI